MSDHPDQAAQPEPSPKPPKQSKPADVRSVADVLARLDATNELLGHGLKLLTGLAILFERLLESSPPLGLVSPATTPPNTPAASKPVGKRVAVPAAVIGTAQGNRQPPASKDKTKVPGFARRMATGGTGPTPVPSPTPSPTSSTDKLSQAFALGHEAAAELGPVEGAILKAKLEALAADLAKLQGKR